jgi:hypothetical protein
VPAAGAGEWQEVIYTPQWNIYQNRYDRDYSFTVPAGTTNLVIQNSEGDWMTVREYGFRPASWPTNREAVLVASDIDWGRRQTNPVTFLPGAPEPFCAAASQDRAWLWRDSIEPWLSLRARGVGVMVGEWGAHNRTPHVVTLAWMRSALENFELSGLGWALWNLDGSFGPVNGGRADVTYENYQGLRLDRKMFDLLREFTGGRETYPRWRDRMFRDRGEPPALQEPGASAVPGGPANYFRYATGTTFSGVDSGPAVRLSSVPGGLEVRFRRSRREVGSLLGIQESADLRSWTDLPDATPGTVGATHDTEWLARRVPDSPTPRFFRLKVTPPEPGATYSYGAP